MINSIRAKSTGPWRIDQNTMIPSGYMSILSRISTKADVYNDRREIFPKISSVRPKERPSPISNRTSPFSRSKIDQPSHEDQFTGYLAKIKRQQLIEAEQRRGTSPRRKLPPLTVDSVREYPGITNEGIRRLLNNTFTRMNREQATQRARAARERQEVLENLREYDEKPINIILQEKHIETVINDFHDLDKAPDSVVNDLRVERMFKKLGKSALSSRRESPRALSTTINSTTRRTARLQSVERELAITTTNKTITEQQDGISNKVTTFSNDDEYEEATPFKPSIFKNTEAMFGQKLDLSRVKRNHTRSKKLAKKRSKSALPIAKLSETSIVEDPFTVRAIETFINDNYETTIEPTDSPKKGSQQLLVLRAKNNNETIDNTTPSGRASRTNTNSPFRDTSSKRGYYMSNSKISQREEYLQKFADFRRHLEMVQQTNNGSIREIDTFNAFLNRDHGRLRGHANKIVPVNEKELNDNLELIKAGIELELKLKKAKENSLESRRVDRMIMISDKIKTKSVIDKTKQMVELENRSSRKTEQRLRKILMDLETL